jgi:4-hydroxy-tetrahydrodipicolinate synthase
MSPKIKFQPKGVITATLLAFNDDFSIDEATTRAHLKDCATVRGVTGITVNGHASEVHSCSAEEQKQILETALDAIGDIQPVICGAYSGSGNSVEAAKAARTAQAAGASAILVFPNQVLAGGGELRPEMALAHFKRIADATELPLIVFQYGAGSGLSYSLDTLLRLFDAVPSIVAMKDGCNDPVLHERHIETLHNLPRPVNVLNTNSAWLMASQTYGAAGILSGAGSVVADLQVGIFESLRDGDLERARRFNARYAPMSRVFYRQPSLDMHNRMKEALVLLGKWKRAVVRPPLLKVSDKEIAGIRAAIVEAKLDQALDQAAE